MQLIEEEKARTRACPSFLHFHFFIRLALGYGSFGPRRPWIRTTDTGIFSLLLGTADPPPITTLPVSLFSSSSERPTSKQWTISLKLKNREPKGASPCWPGRPSPYRSSRIFFASDATLYFKKEALRSGDPRGAVLSSGGLYQEVLSLT